MAESNYSNTSNNNRSEGRNTDSQRSGGPGGRRFVFKKKFCRFCKNPDIEIDYKNVDLLSKYTKDKGRILPKRFTGNCTLHQRSIARAIKRSRSIALMGYVSK